MMSHWSNEASVSADYIDGSLLLNSTPQNNCRESRSMNHAVKWGCVKQTLSYILRFFFWSSGYNRHVSWISKAYSLFIFLLCWYHVVYESFKTYGCSGFICNQKNSSLNATTRMEYASYLSASIGAASSYTFMLICLKVMYNSNSNAISPYMALKDMGNSKARIILVTWICLTIVFLAFVLLYVYIRTSRGDVSGSYVKSISDSISFAAQWVSLVSLFAFSCSAFAIGAFASDTFRRIKSHNGGNIDDIILIHKELRAIVSETTNAYSGWFLFHWLLYGVTVIFGFVVVALHKFGHDDLERKIFFAVFFIRHVFLFVFPCICAAYITTTCGAIPSRINNTTSENWQEDHIFRERRNLQMFVSYCAASPVCFKIGRITFTSTLAWCSFFFGGSGLLFHFF